MSEREGHIPDESGPKPLTAQEVNLLQFEKSQLTERVAELRSEVSGAKIALSDAAQGTVIGSDCYSNHTLKEEAERVRGKLLSIGDAMAEHFGDDWEVLAGAYGDNLDAIDSGVASIVGRVAELKGELGDEKAKVAAYDAQRVEVHMEMDHAGFIASDWLDNPAERFRVSFADRVAKLKQRESALEELVEDWTGVAALQSKRADDAEARLTEYEPL